jgi:hypothetical protein
MGNASEVVHVTWPFEIREYFGPYRWISEPFICEKGQIIQIYVDHNFLAWYIDFVPEGAD